MLSGCIGTLQPCSVATNQDGSTTITCPDGSQETVFPGADGDQGEQGEPGEDGRSASVSIEHLEPGDENCEHGGIAITYGLDGDDPSDMETIYVCNSPDGVDGRGAVLDVEVLLVGDENCPNGGVAVTYGYDDEDSEDHEVVYVCNGRDLIINVGPASLETCPHGGQVIEYGFDVDDLSVIEVCNGADGEDGRSMGLSVIAIEEGDLRCPSGAGGVAISYGYDDIDPEEWDSLTLCNGSDGQDVSLRIDDLEPGDRRCAEGGVEITYSVGDSPERTHVVCNGRDASTDLKIDLVERRPDEVCDYGGIWLVLGYDTSGDGFIDDVVDDVLAQCNDRPKLEPPFDMILGSNVLYYAGPTFLEDQFLAGLSQLHDEWIITLDVVDELDEAIRLLDPDSAYDAAYVFNQDGTPGEFVEPLSEEHVEFLLMWVASGRGLVFADEARTGERMTGGAFDDLYPALGTIIPDDGDMDLFLDFPAMRLGDWESFVEIEGPTEPEFAEAYDNFGWSFFEDRRIGAMSICRPVGMFVFSFAEGAHDTRAISASCGVYYRSTLHFGFVSDYTADQPEFAREFAAQTLAATVSTLIDESLPE